MRVRYYTFTHTNYTVKVAAVFRKVTQLEKSLHILHTQKWSRASELNAIRVAKTA